jgi:hypothetical protein
MFSGETLEQADNGQLRYIYTRTELATQNTGQSWRNDLLGSGGIESNAD